MDHIPYKFVKDVITQVDSLRPFPQLSGQWGEVAIRRKEQIPTFLLFHRTQHSCDIQFAFGHDVPWEAFKNNQNNHSSTSSKRYDSWSAMRNLNFYPLDAENTSFLGRHLKENTHRVEVLLINSTGFEAVKPLLLSIPRISRLDGELWKVGGGCHRILDEIVQRGTLESYRSTYEPEPCDDNFLRPIK
uniref:FBD domain-containing protein n=1 Tax=Steinernema glaseri TaxID=37863 RepID=A0A1I7ZRM5_9BILA